MLYVPFPFLSAYNILTRIPLYLCIQKSILKKERKGTAMSKFNAATENSMKTVNHEGNAAYRMDWRSKLMTMVLTSFFNEAKFYGDNSEELTNILTSGIVDDPQLVSNLAICARREFNMRSVSHVIAGYLANIPAGKPFVKRTVKNIILRGDDATEILAFYLSTFGKPIPNSLRKALREVFPTFDAYALAKYKGDSKSVKMRDILCLCRPAPKDEEQSKLWKDLLEGNISPAYTCETELSAKGNNKETWEALIESGKVGYMALMRNLRNILTADPENIRKVFYKISDLEAVRKNRQLPFRYLSAYRSVGELPMTWKTLEALSALEKAAAISVENLPKIPGKTIIAVDVSASMRSRISSKSDVTCCDISTLLGVIAEKLCESSIVWTFDDQLNIFHTAGSDKMLFTAVNGRHSGGGTDMYLPFEEMLRWRLYADRIIILSDNECNYTFQHGNSWYGRYHNNTTVQILADQYRREINPNFWVHAVDLAGYGTQQFIGAKTNLISGWSEKLFEFVNLAERGTDGLIQRIQNYKVHGEE